ncbi:glycosyltransferase [Methanobacterium bryantii]|uniref:Glycosyl transferase family 1 domain-containing protein n=1 Tax=Methanobacterium bryantii TaxID=2161 RepID=A0A2A2HA45_METBR|nr:glycosyltransferase [Methanobacterium bryantii]PAV06302.1 hypothetical protein ASJ80_15875 [Methanobacterium bryantii]
MNISKLTKKIKDFTKFKEYNAFYRRYFSNKNFKKYSDFAKYTKKSFINKMILYESSAGKSIEGNPYALFRYLLNNPDYGSFTHVWSITRLSDNSIINKYKKYKNVKFVKKNSKEHIKYLAKSKYVISDSTLPDYYFRREGQVYVNCWSDTPLNAIGKDNELNISKQGSIQRNLLNASYLIYPNRYSIDKLLKAYDINTLVNGCILDTGHPRVDFLYTADKTRLKDILNISKLDKVILYVPQLNEKLNTELYTEYLINNIEFLKDKLNGKYKFIVKLPMKLSKFVTGSLKDLIVPDDIDINELLSIVDILITNSSISFDFLKTKKPIIYFIDDRIDEFNSYLPLEELPGPLCHNANEIMDTINDIKSISKKYKNKYSIAIERFSYNDDGNACKRAVDSIFNKIEKYADNTRNLKKKILFYPGILKTNGITSSFSNLLDNIDYEKYDVSVLVYPISKNNEHYEDIKTNLKKLNKNANIIYMSHGFNFLRGEYYYHDFIMKNGIAEDITDKIPEDLYIREIKRLLGNTRFDIFVDFGGYDKIITLLFALSDIKTKCIYLHNNMVREYELRFKSLSVTFDLYKYYDKLITVSEDSKQENSVNFKEYGMDIDDKLIHVTNSIDYNTIIKKSSSGKVVTVNSAPYYFTQYVKDDFFVDLNGIAAPLKSNVNFIAVGRLSPEKDHKKLLTAFSSVLKTHTNVKLYIIGDGPLKESLINFADDIGILYNVIFTGNLFNPYWLLDKCDCMVHSSNYEGQGIVILEALVLGKNVISTDIAGPRKILQGGYGKLVDNSAEALAEAMIKFIEEGMSSKPFDYVKYNETAMNQFYEEVCGE